MLERFDEPYQPTGSMDASSARRALGVTDMGFWDVFLREAIQNSSDARGETHQITFRASAIHLTGDGLSALRDEVLSSLPPKLLGFEEDLAQGATLLVVADEGTRGLGGPLRADVVPPEGVRPDFCDFVRNVGRDESKELGGGTYGFGKSVFYNASQVRTCIIYTQAIVEGRIEPRLIVSRVDQQYEHEQRKYTGRHWWGRTADDGFIDPLVGDDARDLAMSLGIAPASSKTTGTVIAVVSPVNLDPDDDAHLGTIVRQIAKSASRWAWPHMVDLGDGPSVKFEFDIDGEAVDIAVPESHPVLRHYVSSYRKASETLESGATEESWPTSVSAIRSVRPVGHLGQLAHTKWIGADEQVDEWSDQHHVALMRTPRLVVKYMPVEADPQGQQIAGVFISAPKYNDDFAKAEPAAHDDWRPPVSPARSGSRPSSPVRLALSRIAETFRSGRTALESAVSADQSPGIARMSALLGKSLAGLTGGPEVQASRTSTRGGSGQPASRIRLIGDPVLGLDEDGVFADFRIEVGGLQAGALLEAEPQVVLDRGFERENDRPEGAEVPSVVGWVIEDAPLVPGSTWVAGDLKPIAVRVRQPARSAVTVTLREVESR